MKALVLRDCAVAAAETADALAERGFQTYCVTSRDLAQAMIRAVVIDLIIMDERVAGRLTHAVALSAERRNPYVSTIMLADQFGAAKGELPDLIPSLHALLDPDASAGTLGSVALSAAANIQETALRVAQNKAADAAEATCDDMADLGALLDDLSDAEPDESAFALPGLIRLAAMPRPGWGDLANLAPHRASICA
ncbi:MULTISPECIES: imidazoleglycerol-phosphate dehydratase [unclassified Yoonia]|uniref:imidazoleglycerol-phosphate dehydratase n=1 Tax=unclassified Yoonia TaxID=2629118 RepID=UPI002AFFDF45|nr:MULTISPECIES: imidazoleglycerol-phosphate dehydratase [unclassified Yoonia]